MPPKFKFTRDEMIRSALEIVREKGLSNLTARSLAAKLGCSVKPIFGLFQNMEEVQREVLAAADTLYQAYLKEAFEDEKYPPYKASGMAYIRFAKEEKELFKLLFMRDRTGEEIEEKRDEVQPLIEMIKKKTGLEDEEAYLFHLEMWLYVHGIAVMSATSYLNWDTEFVDRALTDGFLGLKLRYLNKEGEQ